MRGVYSDSMPFYAALEHLPNLATEGFMKAKAHRDSRFDSFNAMRRAEYLSDRVDARENKPIP